ncbi:hypothetical protein [Halomicronema sp. CCY15110]|uniref:hypothetical protein n=1 Tax=Halomicronema sp. CCY15110 TaxID=2767773 RepID=UPI001EF18688|nr:hypothetical protein [Halomicronema sp. CCY15110]
MPTDSVFQGRYCRLCFKLRDRDVAELFWLCGFNFSHETVREWSERLTPTFAEHIHAKRQQTFGRIWYAVLGKSVQHQVSKSVHHPVEQSHRQLKPRYYLTLGFSQAEIAGYFCEAVKALNQFLRVRESMGEVVSLPEYRSQIKARMSELRDMMKAAQE